MSDAAKIVQGVTDALPEVLRVACRVAGLDIAHVGTAWDAIREAQRIHLRAQLGGVADAIDFKQAAIEAAGKLLAYAAAMEAERS